MFLCKNKENKSPNNAVLVYFSLKNEICFSKLASKPSKKKDKFVRMVVVSAVCVMYDTYSRKL